MKIKLIILSLVTLAVGGMFLASKFQSDETIVSAQYEMLACEDCNHMIVGKSKGGYLDGETIIPISNTIDIEQLIDSIAITKEPLCLRGKPYRFNWNLFGINPDGKRFEVTERISLKFCSAL